MKQKLTLKEKVSQLFISKNPDSIVDIEEFINQGIGGFMIGKGGEIVNYNQKDLEGDSKESLKRFIKSIRELSEKNKKTPLFLAIDGEGGSYFNRLKSFSTLKSARIYGKKFERDGNLDYFIGEISKFAKLMNELDINMNFAPLLDVAKKGYRGYVAEERIKVRKNDLTKSEMEASNRSYSDKPEVVSILGTTAMKVYQEHNIIPTLKHFPSYGILDDNENPHEVLPVSKLSLSTILKQVNQYKKAIKMDAYAMMTGHVTTALDKDRPASISKKVYKFVRDKLRFKGLMVVDELNMGAIKQFYGFTSVEKAAIDAIKANDIILISHPDTFVFMRNAIFEEAKKSWEMRKVVNNRYKRIIKYKKKIGLI